MEPIEEDKSKILETKDFNREDCNLSRDKSVEIRYNLMPRARYKESLDFLKNEF